MFRPIPVNPFLCSPFLNQGMTDAFPDPSPETGLSVRDEFSSGGGGGDTLPAIRRHISEKVLARCPILADPRWKSVASVLIEEVLESMTSRGQEALEDLIEQGIRDLKERLEQRTDSSNALRLLNELRAVDEFKTWDHAEVLSKLLLEPSFPEPLVERVLGLFRTQGLGAADPSVAWKTLLALKTVALYIPETAGAQRAVEVLYTEGLENPDENVAGLAAKQLEDLANAVPARIPLAAVAALRARGLDPRVSRNLALAALNALRCLVSPVGVSPSEDMTVSRQALQVLFADGLAHPNEEIAAMAYRRLSALRSDRPDIFTPDILEALETKKKSLS